MMAGQLISAMPCLTGHPHHDHLLVNHHSSESDQLDCALRSAPHIMSNFGLAGAKWTNLALTMSMTTTTLTETCCMVTYRSIS